MHAAIIDEIEYFAAHVFVAVPIEEARNDTAGNIIGTSSSDAKPTFRIYIIRDFSEGKENGFCSYGKDRAR